MRVLKQFNSLRGSKKSGECKSIHNPGGGGYLCNPIQI